MESGESRINEEIEIKNSENKHNPEKKNSKIGAIILGVSGISAVFAGLATSHITKKRNQDILKEISKAKPHVLLESPHSLAVRALAWGTVWAVGGVSLVSFGVWKLFGFKDLNDFKTRLRNQIKKSASSTNERTEFENLADLINYLNELDVQKKAKGN